MSGIPEFHYVGGELGLFAEAQNWKAYWSSLIRPMLRGAVLEVGAGMGTNTVLLRSSQQTSWMCLEPDQALVQLMNRRFQQQPPDGACDVVRGRLEDLPAGRRFDAILYIDVLEHIKEDRAELDRAAKFLLPGGHLIILSPAHQWLFSRFDAEIGHFRRYTRKSLLAISPDAMRVRRSLYLDSCGLFLSLCNRLFLRQALPSPRQIRFWDKVVVPVSRCMDPILCRSFGKSVLVAWTLGRA